MVRTMVTFALVLALVTAVQTEPLDQRMAPRSIALEISRVAQTPEEAAIRVQMAWDESRLIPDAVGDSGKSFCAFQLQRNKLSVAEHRETLTDIRKCVEVADRRLRDSAAACPGAPLSSYAAGSCQAVKLSARRIAAARRLLLRAMAIDG